MSQSVFSRALGVSIAATLSLCALSASADDTSTTTPSAMPPATSTTETRTVTTESTTQPAASQPNVTSEPNVTVVSDSTGPTRSYSSSEPMLDTETTRLTWPNVPLLATGATVFTVGYVPAVVGGALSDRNDKDLYIPVAGPWMTLANGPSETGGEKALLIADGAVQGLGALMLVTSFFIPEKTTKNWYLIGSNNKVRVTPSSYASGAGLYASGRF